MEHLLEPIEEPLNQHSQSTPDSLYAERLVNTFLEYGASMAVVKVDQTPYDLGTLYELCRRVCRKKSFIKIVEAHKDNGRLVLVRLKEKSK